MAEDRATALQELLHQKERIIQELNTAAVSQASRLLGW